MPPPPAFAPEPSHDKFETALTVISILKDAMTVAEAEVRRQMARRAATPSHVGLEDLMNVLMGKSDGDSKGKGKGKGKERKGK